LSTIHNDSEESRKGGGIVVKEWDGWRVTWKGNIEGIIELIESIESNHRSDH